MKKIIFSLLVLVLSSCTCECYKCLETYFDKGGVGYNYQYQEVLQFKDGNDKTITIDKNSPLGNYIFTEAPKSKCKIFLANGKNLDSQQYKIWRLRSICSVGNYDTLKKYYSDRYNRLLDSNYYKWKINLKHK